MRDKNIDFLPIAATSDAELQIEQGPGQEPDKEKNTRPISEKAYLVRKSAGEKVEITKEEFMIGRGTKRVDYSIYDDKTVSRLHCRIITDKGKSWIEDLGSLNGTSVNGRKLDSFTPEPLEDGSVIKISKEDFTFHKS